MLNLYRYWDLIDDEDSFEMISRRYIDRLIECMVNLFNSECKLTKSEKREEIKKYFADNYLYFEKQVETLKRENMI